MQPHQRAARDYCASIGADPDAVVGGYWDTGQGHTEWTTAPRWSWYVATGVGNRTPITNPRPGIKAGMNAGRASNL